MTFLSVWHMWLCCLDVWAFLMHEKYIRDDLSGSISWSHFLYLWISLPSNVRLTVLELVEIVFWCLLSHSRKTTLVFLFTSVFRVITWYGLFTALSGSFLCVSCLYVFKSCSMYVSNYSKEHLWRFSLCVWCKTISKSVNILKLL